MNPFNPQYSLKNAAFRRSFRGPGKLFDLGQRYGWRPRGTDFNVAMHRQELQLSGVPDEQIDGHLAAAAAAWSGFYSSNNWQVVTAVDAIAWAAALQRALPQLNKRPRFSNPR